MFDTIGVHRNIVSLLVQVTMSSNATVTTSSVKKELNNTEIPITTTTTASEFRQQPTTTHLDHHSVTKGIKPLDEDISGDRHPKKKIDGMYICKMTLIFVDLLFPRFAFSSVYEYFHDWISRCDNFLHLEKVEWKTLWSE